MEDGSKAHVVEDRVQQWHLQVLAVLREMLTLPREEDKDGQKLERWRRDDGVSGIFLSLHKTHGAAIIWGRESRGHDGLVWRQGASQSRRPS
jgi:hypothetical protein